MNKSVIELAKEAGFEVNYYKSLESEEIVSFDPIITGQLERFAALVRAEREWIDLTDDEMWAVFISRDWVGEPLHLMSAVIAAFKEKNK